MNGNYSISLDGTVSWEGDELYITVLFNNMTGWYFETVRQIEYLRDMETVANEQGVPLKFNQGSVIAKIDPYGTVIDSHVLDIAI